MKEKNLKSSEKVQKSNKGKIIIISIISAVVIFAVITVVWFFNSPLTKFNEFIENNDPWSAASVYNNYSSYNALDKYLLDEQANALIDECIEVCENENVYANGVNETLSALSNIQNKELADKASNNLNYYSGKYDYENENYSGAVYYYSKLEGTDFMTQEVEKQLEESKIEYKEEILSMPDFTGVREDYYNLINSIDEAYYLLDEDPEIREKQEDLIKAYTSFEAQGIEDDVNKLLEEENYEEALLTVTRNQPVLQEDNRYDRLYKLTSESYEENIKEEFNALVEDGKTEEAITLIDNAIMILPEKSDEFTEMKDNIE